MVSGIEPRTGVCVSTSTLGVSVVEIAGLGGPADAAQPASDNNITTGAAWAGLVFII
jgi:hypothetical protein